MNELTPITPGEEVARIGTLADKFESQVRSGAFSWMGVLSGFDSRNHPIVDIYLTERSLPQSRKGRTGPADALNTFDELALSLEPGVIASIHMISEEAMNPDQLREELHNLGQPPNRMALIWERTF